jgi:hypothetical protein
MGRQSRLLFLAGMVMGFLVTGGYALLAQDRPREDRPPDAAPVAKARPADAPRVAQEAVVEAVEVSPRARGDNERGPSATIQEALLRPYHFPFGRPTPLAEVCAHLRDTLKGPVVLDLAALERQSVEATDPVQLELDGVRLKTGLKLLFDQVGLTFRVVAEDNLMIITDDEGAEDPSQKIWAELKALHRDLHAVQDSVDELSDYLGLDAEGGPRVHKPTIIEEMPENPTEKPGPAQARPGRGDGKPDGPAVPEQGARPLPGRVPLGGTRRPG